MTMRRRRIVASLAAASVCDGRRAGAVTVVIALEVACHFPQSGPAQQAIVRGTLSSVSALDPHP